MEEGAKFPVFAWPKRFFLYAATLLPFPHSGLATLLHQDGFSRGDRFVFRTEQTFRNGGEEDEPTRGNAAQAEKSPAQGVNPARGCI